MIVTLDHTVVACSDSEAAARRFAGIMGLEMGEWEGVPASSCPFAFVVDDSTFDQIRLRLLKKASSSAMIP